MATPPDRAVDLIEGRPLVAYVAVATPDGEPSVRPRWYAYHRGNVEFFAGGRLLETIRENARVAMTIPVDVEGYGDWHISVRGEATVVEDSDLIEAAAARLYPTYVDDAWSVEREAFPPANDDALVVVDARIRGVAA